MAGEDSRYPWEVLFVVMLGTLMAALDSSIVNVSIPPIMADFGSSVDDIEWVVTGYMLAFAVFMPVTTYFREHIGHRLLYTASLVVFVAGSVLCGLAWNLPSLVVARVIQAIGGGAITPTGMAMISEVFPPRERGRAMGYWGVGVIAGPAVGPTLGGFLTSAFGWRSIFLVNLPIGILGTFLALRILRKDRPHAASDKPFDVPGFISLSAFLISLLLALAQGETRGWDSPLIVICWIIAAVSFVFFLLIETQVEHPIVDLSLFLIPTFAVCSLITAVRSVALFGGVFLLPLFLQNQMGYDEVDSGLILLPGSVIIGIFMPFAGKFSDRAGPRIPAFLGLLGVAAFMFMYRELEINTSLWGIILPTLVRGAGIGLLIAPIMATALNALPLQRAGMASSILNLVQQIGGSVGIAILALVLSHRAHHHAHTVFARLDAGTFQEKGRIVAVQLHQAGYSHLDAGTIASVQLAKTVQASLASMAYQDAFLAGGIIVLFALPFAFLLPGTGTKSVGPIAME